MDKKKLVFSWRWSRWRESRGHPRHTEVQRGREGGGGQLQGSVGGGEQGETYLRLKY